MRQLGNATYIFNRTATGWSAPIKLTKSATTNGSRDEQKFDLMADVINRLPEGNVRSGLVTQLARQKAQIDLDAAVAWVSNWPDSPERNKAISALIGNRISQSPEDTTTLVERVLAAGMLPDETAIDMLVNQWQYQSPMKLNNGRLTYRTARLKRGHCRFWILCANKTTKNDMAFSVKTHQNQKYFDG